MINIFVSAGAIVSIVLGLLVLIFPKFLRYIIGFYLIIIGILSLLGGL